MKPKCCSMTCLKLEEEVLISFLTSFCFGHFTSCFLPLTLPRSLFWDGTAKFFYCQCIMYYLCCLLYLVVVEEVHADLHDAREDHQNGGGDKEGVDVV